MSAKLINFGMIVALTSGVLGCRMPAAHVTPVRVRASDLGRCRDVAGTNASSSGVLVRLSMASTVGILLDEIPEESRGDVRQYYQDEQFWTELAKAQVRMMKTRFYLRGFYHPQEENLGPLPLPPEKTDDDRDLWKIAFTTAPTRDHIDGHAVLVRDYILKGGPRVPEGS
jgi:hypothetical protein